MPVTNYRESLDRGAPVDLFLFTYGTGSGDYYAYCNAEEPIAFGGKTYVPAPIDRSSIKSKGKPSETDITVTVASDSEIAQLFRGFAPRRVILLQIYQGHIARPDERADLAATGGPSLIWTGRVVESTRKRQNTELSCDTLGAGMERPGFTVSYARECQRVLYGDRCQASKAAATSSATVVSMTRATLTLQSGWNASDRSNYIGGLVEWNGQYGPETRTILNVVNDILTLDGPAPDLDNGDTVSVILGCPRTRAACASLHNNILNYGGTFAIPLENPIGKNNH